MGWQECRLYPSCDGVDSQSGGYVFLCYSGMGFPYCILLYDVYCFCFLALRSNYFLTYANVPFAV